MSPITFYKSYEDREEAFQKLSNIFIPQLSGGTRTALEHVRKAMVLGHDDVRTGDRTAVIPSDPSLALLFPTGREELLAAAARAQKHFKPSSVFAVAAQHGLSAEKLAQSVRTLSGGERCLLALAKCTLLAGSGRRLVMCNPEPWLSIDNLGKISAVIHYYTERECRWDALCLTGEVACLHASSSEAPEAIDEMNNTGSFWGPEVRLHCKQLSVILADPTGLSQAPPIRLKYDCEFTATSPILWSAPNGAGKSTLGMVLSKAIIPESGRFRLLANGRYGSGRMLMQRCAHQLFGAAPLNYIRWSFREAPQALKVGLEEFHHLQSEVVTRALQYDPDAIIGSSDYPDSLLQAKIALAAVRLVEKPPLLILDEPGFGLTLPVARAFVESVAVRAAVHSIGLLIISHQPHAYRHIIASVLSSDTQQIPQGRLVKLSVVKSLESVA